MKVSGSKLWPLGALIWVLLPVANSNALAAAQPAAQAAPLQASGSASRPANVPSEYVNTPFGYFHPSCVRSVGKQDIQLADGRIQHPNGVTEGSASCNYPHYLKDGSTGPVGKAKAARAHGGSGNPAYVSDGEDAEVQTSEQTPYGGLHGFWVVPEKPKADDLQLLYFWQGMEDAGSGESVLQPVMRWAGISQWTISSWNCCLDNIVTESTPVSVSTGDVIYGSITSNCAPGTISCATWNVLAVDLTTGQSSLLADTPSEGQIFSWGFGAFLEPDGVKSCDDYPQGGPLRFWDVTLLDTNMKPIHRPQWVNGYTSTPHCNFKMKLEDPKDLAMYY